MPRFIHVDHCLCGPGGHYHEYALQIVAAAAEAGCEVVLATNRDFHDVTSLPTTWRVLPLFRYPMYYDHAAFDTRGPRERGLGTWLRTAVEAWHGFWRRSKRKHRTTDFAASCHRLIQEIGVTKDDHFFFATMSVFEFAALAQFLSTTPETRQATWHVQVHFEVYAGREPDYEQQAARSQLLRNAWQAALSLVPDHRLHFYTTTEAMTDQHNRLQVAKFQYLPWGVRSTLRPREPVSKTPRPLRTTLAGYVRDEKGRHEIGSMLQQLWLVQLASGDVQLQLQGCKPKVRQAIEKQIENSHLAWAWSGGEPVDTEPVIFVRHPLPAEEYAELIATSDIGLFLYDSYRYYARCSGILAEMLAAGVPVIVPAGCWLAEQIAEPIQEHLAQVRLRIKDERPVLRQQNVLLADDEIIWTRPDDKTIDHLLVEWQLESSAPAGCYVRLDVKQLDDDGQPCSTQTDIPGRRLASPTTAQPPASRVLVRLAPTTCQVRFSLRNAYHDLAMRLDELVVLPIRSAEMPAGTIAAGAVGLIAADNNQLARLIQEMKTNYVHFHQTAVQFSQSWRQAHAPALAVSQILNSH